MLFDLTKAGILQGQCKTVKPGNARYPFLNGTKSFCFMSTSRRKRNGIQRSRFHCFLSFCFVFAAMLEYLVSSRRGRALYFHLHSTISNMSSNYQPKTETEVTKE